MTTPSDDRAGSAHPGPDTTEPHPDEPIDAELVPLDDEDGVPTGEHDAPAAEAGETPNAAGGRHLPAAGPGSVDPGHPVPHTDIGYTDNGVPTFDAVRDKIEQRVGRAIGTEELDASTPAGRDLDDAWEKRQEAAKDKLEQIRRSMREGR